MKTLAIIITICATIALGATVHVLISKNDNTSQLVTNQSQDERAAVTTLKRNLNDTTGFELIYFTPIDTMCYGLNGNDINRKGIGKIYAIQYRMRFRARNPFGGLILCEYYFYVEQNKNKSIIGYGKESERRINN